VNRPASGRVWLGRGPDVGPQSRRSPVGRYWAREKPMCVKPPVSLRVTPVATSTSKTSPKGAFSMNTRRLPSGDQSGRAPKVVRTRM
jgi:hypothetical protein